jgi:hypothetical protein
MRRSAWPSSWPPQGPPFDGLWLATRSGPRLCVGAALIAHSGSHPPGLPPGLATWACTLGLAHLGSQTRACTRGRAGRGHAPRLAPLWPLFGPALAPLCLGLASRTGLAPHHGRDPDAQGSLPSGSPVDIDWPPANFALAMPAARWLRAPTRKRMRQMPATDRNPLLQRAARLTTSAAPTFAL